ncbi:hypothetical protein BDW72DRAFT_38777 [Aspergillus terricola var. indicus]
MAESKGHGSKAFFRNITHTLPKTFKKNICPRSKRILCNTNSVMQSRLTSVPAREFSSIPSYESRRPRSTRIVSAPEHRCLTKPDNTDHEDHKHKYEHEHIHEAHPEIEHDENISQPTGVTKGLRIRRLNSRPHLFQLPRTQASTTLNDRSTFPPSRLPTPTGPPHNARYSHSVYQREGRRSVLSPIGRRWAMQTPVTTQSTIQRPSTQTSALYCQLSSSLKVVRRPLAQYDNSNTTPDVTVPASASALAHIEKERASGNSNHHLPLYYQIRNRVSSLDTASIEATRSAMTSPKRLRLTQGFTDLRAQETLQTRIPTLQQILNPSSTKSTGQLQKLHLQRQPHEYIKENDAPTAQRAHLQQTAHQPQHTSIEMTPERSKDPVSQLPALSPTSFRRKMQNEKMVMASFPARSSQTPISSVPSRASKPKRRPVLTPQMVGRLQVETAMPQEYWLGRFMTLTNAFHYEDSFNEPDIATGFEMPSSYSRPFQGSDDGDMAAYRVKRAFMVLENRCVSEEASASLQDFREAYIRRFGDQWMH